MTLAFSTHWSTNMPLYTAGKLTYFQEKIIECMLRNKSVKVEHSAWEKYLVNTELGQYVIGNQKPKLHTIREDRSNRWKAGMDIHFVINNRTPQRFQFAPVIKCTAVQQIEIRHRDEDNFPVAQPKVYIDGVWLPEVQPLAVNDGFNSVDDFFAWFNTDFTGKIIHWTDFRY